MDISHAEAPSPAPIPLFDLKRQQARLRADIDRRIAMVLDHGQFILGPEVSELETSLAMFSGVKHAVGVSSGRDALIMALMALNVGAGDAVLVPGFTFSATAAVVMSVGAVPVFVDVRSTDYNMDPAGIGDAVARARTKGLRPKAVMPVDLFGRAADYRSISAIAAEHGLRVIADAAQSFGAVSPHGRVGMLAPISCVSFYPTKPLGAFGDGGAILTDDDDLADAVRAIRTHGRAGDGDEAMRIGMTGRLDTIQAAVLLSKIEGFEAELKRREGIAARYHNHLSNICACPPTDDVGHRSAWALYTVQVPNRDAVRSALADAGIATGLFYRVALHKHPAFAAHARGTVLPVSERLADTVLSLPMGPDLTDEEVDRVASTLAGLLIPNRKKVV